MTKHADLIDGLGGATQLAGAFADLLGIEVNRKTIHMWKRNGVPWRYRHAVARLASDADVPLPPGFLGDTAPTEARVG